MDDEIKAIRTCVSALEDLPVLARARTAAYLFDRYGDTSLFSKVLKEAIEKVEGFEKWKAQLEREIAELIETIRTMPITPRDDEPIARRPVSIPKPEGDPAAGGEVGGSASPDEREPTPEEVRDFDGEDDDPDINNLDDEDDEEPTVISASIPPPAPREPDEDGLVEV